METKKQLGELHLKGRHLIIQRYGRDGQPSGKRTFWRVKRVSNLSRDVFFIVVGFLRQSIKRKGTMDEPTAAVESALRAAGKALGCKIGDSKKLADLYWLVDGKRLIGWQIHQRRVEQNREWKLQKSKALLRIIVVVKRGGYFEIKPQRTRHSHE